MVCSYRFACSAPAHAPVCRTPQGGSTICTLLSLPWSRGSYGAAVGLHRDERYGHPSTPPHWWPPAPDGAGFVAPRDLEGSGTWFGLGEHGLFVAITNGHQTGPFRRERSRGALVVDALRAGQLDRAVATLTSRDAFAYAACYLLLAQRVVIAYLASDTGRSFQTTTDCARPHTLRNDGNDGNDAGAAAWTASSRSGRATASDLHTLRRALASPHPPFPLCRHDVIAGTRSSAVVLLWTTRANSRLFYADRRPCESPLQRLPRDVAAQ